MGNANLPGNAKYSSPIAHHPSRLSIIVAMARNGVIGARGSIPWHLPDELKRFRNITMGHHIIMGRKTWESIGRPLSGRTSVVVTRQTGYRAPGAIVAHSLDNAIEACRDDEEIFVIGGAELYAQALPHANRIYLTVVDADVEGDTCMPELDARSWREVASHSFAADERHAYPYRCSIHERARD